jgi:Protein of unknown function (DUF2752)
MVARGARPPHLDVHSPAHVTGHANGHGHAHGQDHAHGHAVGLDAGGPDPTSRPRRGPGRRIQLAAIAGVTTFTGYVFLADPDSGAVYPQCPSRMLLGIDCPFCGGLRGTNALLHGRIEESLDHNLLLPGLLATFAVMLGLAVLSVVGRPLPAISVPRWLKVTAVAVLAGFMVTRNLPVDSLEYLASEA